MTIPNLTTKLDGLVVGDILDQSTLALRNESLRCDLSVMGEISQLENWVEDPSHKWDTTQSTGQELEFVIVDKNTLRPVKSSLELLPKLEQEFGTVFGSELLQSNVEMSTAPTRLGAGALAAGEQEITTAWRRASQIAEESGQVLYAGGILPTYALSDFQDTAMLYPERYEAMNRILMSRLQGSFSLDFMEGNVPVTFDNFSVEGAPTSHQVHLSASPEMLVKMYNASLAVMAPLIAVSANSPFFCGKTGWHESRIVLLEQGAAAERFLFSSGFAHSPADLFSDLKGFAPLTYTEEGQEMLLGKKKDIGCNPEHLPSFQAQNGTVWKWLRPCYYANGSDAAHIRLEQRILPAGPTPVDMAANAAFYIGAVHGLVAMNMEIPGEFAFKNLKDNFYAGAKEGLSAQMTWRNGEQMTAQEIVRELLPIARIGLEAIGASPEEIDGYLDVIRERNNCGMTPAAWMIASVESLEAAGATREQALNLTTQEVVNNQQRNLNGERTPIHTWKFPELH